MKRIGRKKKKEKKNVGRETKITHRGNTRSLRRVR